MPFCRGAGDILEDWCDTCVGFYQRKEGFPERL
jgi:DnaJ-class molecular chaperone